MAVQDGRIEGGEMLVGASRWKPEVEVEVGRDGSLSEHKEIASTTRTSNKMLCK